MAKQQEAIIKTQLLTAQLTSPAKARAESTTFRQWAHQYFQLAEVKKSKATACDVITFATWSVFLGNNSLGAITPQDVRLYRQQRVGPNGRPLAVQTINHDHTALVHMLNVAKCPQFSLIKDSGPT